MNDSRGLIYKINRAFLLQGGLIAIAAVLGVFFAKIVIEQILIRNAVSEEELYFWEQYQKNSQFPLPDTKNLTGFFDPQALPQEIKHNLPQDEGFHEYGSGDQRTVLHISERNHKKLYLLYFRGQVDALVLYYGIFPLFTVLLILYLSLWMTYRFNRRTISPVIKLAQQINQLDLNNPDFSSLSHDRLKFDTDTEISILSDAMVHLGDRLAEFIARERNFTRDASHELRSPLTVINIATDMLLSEQQLSKPAYNSVKRIKRAIHDMQRLTEVFLLLARENEKALATGPVDVNRVLQQEIEQAHILKGQKNIEIQFQQNNKINLLTSDMVLSVVLGNLIRNAIHYTDQGSVRISVEGLRVSIIDSGQGMSRVDMGSIFKPFHRGENVNAAGYGIGLTIVKRLSDRYHWPINVSSKPAEGTCFTVEFPEGTVQP